MDSKNKNYSNGEIMVHWKPRKCIHATTCYVELIDVFNPRKRPWINMEGATTEKIIEVVNKCPTQALSYTEIKPIKIKTEESETGLLTEECEIKIMKEGPIIVKGSFRLFGVDKKFDNFKIRSRDQDRTGVLSVTARYFTTKLLLT